MYTYMADGLAHRLCGEVVAGARNGWQRVGGGELERGEEGGPSGADGARAALNHVREADEEQVLDFVRRSGGHQVLRHTIKRLSVAT